MGRALVQACTVLPRREQERLKKQQKKLKITNYKLRFHLNLKALNEGVRGVGSEMIREEFLLNFEFWDEKKCVGFGWWRCGPHLFQMDRVLTSTPVSTH